MRAFWEFLGVRWFDDAGDELTQESTDLVPTLRPGKQVVWAESFTAGAQLVPVTDGNLDDPQPLYVVNPDGIPVFMMVTLGD